VRSVRIFERPATPDVEVITTGPLPAKTTSQGSPAVEEQRLVQGSTFRGSGGHYSLLGAQHLIDEALKNNRLARGGGGLAPAWENVYAGEGAFFPTAVVGLFAEPQQDRDRRRFHVGLGG